MTNTKFQRLLKEAETKPGLMKLLLRKNFALFIGKVFSTLNPSAAYLSNWHILAIAWHLEEVRAGRIRRLIINMPPRSLKSISASVAFSAFIHGHDPGKHIISATYAQDFSVKLHNDYRTILASRWYKELFPGTMLDRRKDTENETALTGRGTRLATSIGGVITGRGADYIIIDDPLKPADAMSDAKRDGVNDWYGTTLVSRLNDKRTGAIIVVTQRVHAYDLVGHLLGTAADEWTVLNLPAEATQNEIIRIGDTRQYSRSTGDILHPGREPKAVLDQLRRDIGSDAYEAQYQQNPAPPGGAMFKRAWLRHYATLPPAQDDDVVIQSWDTASKNGPANDWSVCTTWRISKNQYYLLDVVRDKFDYPQLKACAIRQASRYEPRVVLIEDAGVGTGLIAELRQRGINVVEVKPTTSKEARASVKSAMFEGGRVFFPERASWLPELQNELLSFPGSRHDDQVDSVVQALDYVPEEPGGVMLFNWGPNGIRRVK
jgi:predicted phage terminase large subunit-like protein